MGAADPRTTLAAFDPQAKRTDSFTFQVNDGTANSNVATISITVTPVNDAPESNAGPDQVVGSDTLVTLNGSGSSDPDGDTVTYKWRKVSGPAVTLSSTTTANPTFIAPTVTGNTTVTFRLVVADPAGLTAKDLVTMTITP